MKPERQTRAGNLCAEDIGRRLRFYDGYGEEQSGILSFFSVDRYRDVDERVLISLDAGDPMENAGWFVETDRAVWVD